MSQKKLLEEQVVRRFMKLANINETLSEGFVKENMDMSQEQPAQMEEVDDLVDVEGGDEGGGEGNEDLFKKVAQAVADAMGVDASIEGGAGGDELEMGDDEDMEEPEDDMSSDEEEPEDDMGDDEEEDEEGDEEEEEELEEGYGEEEVEEGYDKEEVEEQIAETVLNRVKARLLAEAKQAREEMPNIKKKKLAKGKKMEEASKGKHSTGKASSMNWGLKGNKSVGNVAKSKAKKGNLTPAKKSSKHMR